MTGKYIHNEPEAGDIMIFEKEGHAYNKKVFKLIGPAPKERFTLPNGVEHAGMMKGEWILECLSGNIPAEMSGGEKIMTRYGCGRPDKMRILPNEELGTMKEKTIEEIMKDLIDLHKDKISNKARYICADKDGYVFWYSNKPIIRKIDNCWLNEKIGHEWGYVTNNFECSDRWNETLTEIKSGGNHEGEMSDQEEMIIADGKECSHVNKNNCVPNLIEELTIPSWILHERPMTHFMGEHFGGPI